MYSEFGFRPSFGLRTSAFGLQILLRTPFPTHPGEEPVSLPRRRCPIGMSKSLVGRSHGRRVILWGTVCARALDAAVAGVVLFLIVTCAMGASSEAPFFETWWGRHVFVLLLGVLALAVGVVAALPMLRWLRLPLDQLPELEAPSAAEVAAEAAGQRVSRHRPVAVIAVATVPLLVALFYIEEDWRGERAWNQYRQEQEARGEIFDPAALIPPLVRGDQNLATTPYLAPLFDYLPGTQQPRNPKAVESIYTLSPAYSAAASRLKRVKVVRSNSWVLAETDLLAWHTAFLKGEPPAASEQEATEAFRRRYGLPAARPLAPLAARPPAITAPPPTNAPTRAEAVAEVLSALSDCKPGPGGTPRRQPPPALPLQRRLRHREPGLDPPAALRGTQERLPGAATPRVSGAGPRTDWAGPGRPRPPVPAGGCHPQRTVLARAACSHFRSSHGPPAPGRRVEPAPVVRTPVARAGGMLGPVRLSRRRPASLAGRTCLFWQRVH